MQSTWPGLAEMLRNEDLNDHRFGSVLFAQQFQHTIVSIYCLQECKDKKERKNIQ